MNALSTPTIHTTPCHCHSEIQTTVHILLCTWTCFSLLLLELDLKTEQDAVYDLITDNWTVHGHFTFRAVLLQFSQLAISSSLFCFISLKSLSLAYSQYLLTIYCSIRMAGFLNPRSKNMHIGTRRVRHNRCYERTAG